MTSTNVTKAAGLFLDAVSAGTVSSVTDAVDNSFSQVMDRTRQDLGSETPAAKQESMTAAKAPVKVEKSSIKETSDKQTEKSSETKQEAVMADSAQAEDAEVEEAVTEAAQEVAEAIKEELGLSDEELEAVMETLGLTQMDLLRVENVQAIVMAAAGETDQLSILTDENLYQSLQTLTNVVEETVADVQDQLQVDDAAFEDILKQMEVSAEPEMLEMPAEENGPVILVESDAKALQQVQPENEADAETVEKADVSAQEAQTDEMQQPENQTQELTATKEHAQDGAKQERGSSETKHGAGKESYEGSNQILQGMTRTGTDAWSMEAVQNEAEISYQQADMDRIMNQVTDYIKVQTGNELTEMELQLQPETLGTLRIHLTAKEGVVTAQFTAENETVKAVLEAQTVQLKENLNNQGVKVQAVEVTIANQGFNKSFAENGESAAGYEEPKKKAVRKIQLTEDLSIDEMDLSEEDRIAAEMMEANGNTVDYTA